MEFSCPPGNSRKFESRHLSRDNLSREIGRIWTSRCPLQVPSSRLWAPFSPDETLDAVLGERRTTGLEPPPACRPPARSCTAVPSGPRPAPSSRPLRQARTPTHLYLCSCNAKRDRTLNAFCFSDNACRLVLQFHAQTHFRTYALLKFCTYARATRLRMGHIGAQVHTSARTHACMHILQDLRSLGAPVAYYAVEVPPGPVLQLPGLQSFGQACSPDERNEATHGSI